MHHKGNVEIRAFDPTLGRKGDGMRYSNKCKKRVKVLPVYYTAPDNFDGIINVVIIGGEILITVEIKK